MTLIYLALAWIAGLIFASQADPPAVIPLMLILAALPGVVYFRRENPIILGMMLFLGLGMLRFEAARPTTDDQHLIHLNDQGILMVEGQIIAEPEVRDTNQRVLIEAEQAAGRESNGRLLAYLPRETEVGYGDRVQVFGRLVSPPEFDEFSYGDYLARQQVFSLMPGAEVTILDTEGGNPFYRALLDLKQTARQRIIRAVPEPQASLLIGILLGDDSGLSDETEAAFTRVGASHIIAISGFNMVLLAQAIMLVLKTLLPKRPLLAAAIGIIAILIYTLLVGASGAVIRAALMSSLLILGQAMRRKTYVPTSIAFVVLLLSLYDPWFLWDVGFQLSLAAVVGMALFVKPLEGYFKWGVEKLTHQKAAALIMKLLSDSLIVTLAAQITTTPLILYYFGRLSLVSLPANFLIIPVQSLVLFSGAIGLLIALVFPPLGNLLLQIADIFLRWTVAVVRAFADFRWADTELHIGQAVIIAMAIGLLLWVLYEATRPRWAMRLLHGVYLPGYAAYGAVLIALVMLLNQWSTRPDGHLHVTFLDVGHSDSTVIQSPQGGVMVINGGEFPTRLLESLPAAKIDVLIITSLEPARIGALPEVLDRYPVGAIVATTTPAEDDLSQAIVEKAAAHQIEWVTVTPGYTLTTDDQVMLEVLHPEVLRLRYGAAVFLFTGEITAEEEQILLRQPHQVQANVLQLPSHGSDRASSAIFLEVVRPQIAVIQLDPGRASPSPNVLTRLSDLPVYRTDLHGTIRVSSDGTSLWMTTAKETDER